MTQAPDPELEILREAERKRGGCAVFLVGAAAFFVILIPLMLMLPFDEELLQKGLIAAYMLPVLLVGRFALAIGGAVAASKGFNLLRLRLGRKGPPAT